MESINRAFYWNYLLLLWTFSYRTLWYTTPVFELKKNNWLPHLVTIYGSPFQCLIVRTWNNYINKHVQRYALATDLWLSIGQLHLYFWLSGDFCGCPGRTDNQNYEHRHEDTCDPVTSYFRNHYPVGTFYISNIPSNIVIKSFEHEFVKVCYFTKLIKCNISLV